MLHICYILPIFRIKKAPIGAVACPQWVSKKNSTGYATDRITWPIRYSHIYSASVFPGSPDGDTLTAKVAGKPSEASLYLAIDPARSYWVMSIGRVA